MADSTLVLEFFAKLENPALYERVDNVPIFGTHTKKKRLPDGTWQTVKVDAEDLFSIQDACDQMEKKGTLPVITPGHRKLDPRIDEQDQPPVWGFMRWLRPGYYTGPDGNKIKTLLCTKYLSKTEKDKEGTPVNQAARTFPFRSVDYYSDTHEITGLALLRRDPELSDGAALIGYHGNRPIYQYASENVMEPAVPPTQPPNSDTMRPGEMGEDELSPEEAHQCMRYAKHYERHHPAFKYMCERYMAEQGGHEGHGAEHPAVAGQTPGKVGGESPAVAGEKPLQMESDFDKLKNKIAGEKNPPANPAAVAAKVGREKLGEEEMARRSAEGRKEHEQHGRTAVTPEQYERLQAENVTLRSENVTLRTLVTGALSRIDALENEGKQAKRQGLLTQYQAGLEKRNEAYSLGIDVAQEVKDANEMNMTLEQMQRRLAQYDRIGENTSAPIGRSGIQYGRVEPGTGMGLGGLNADPNRKSDGMYKDDVLDRAMQYARQHPGETSWEEIMAHATANGKA
jgi:hypothetical protein